MNEQRPSIKITRHIYLYRTSVANFVEPMNGRTGTPKYHVHMQTINGQQKRIELENITLFLWVNWISSARCRVLFPFSVAKVITPPALLEKLYGLVLHFIPRLFLWNDFNENKLHSANCIHFFGFQWLQLFTMVLLDTLSLLCLCVGTSALKHISLSKYFHKHS